MNSLKSRGAQTNPESRFSSQLTEAFYDSWSQQDEQRAPETVVKAVQARSIISNNQSPDVPFEASINPYQGCEHGCVYCFARPTHEFMDLSPGLDFETKLFYKPDAAELLKQTLRKKNYRCTPIALGANTDCYQPMEKALGLTRAILTVLKEHNHPCAIVTKSNLVVRDIDILKRLAERHLVRVLISVTTLNDDLKRSLEPRTPSPSARLRTIRQLREASVPVGILMAPIIPGVNDHEIEDVICACAGAGAESAGHVLLRLPHQLKSLFYDWLKSYAPLKADHVMNLIKDCRGGKIYDSDFGQRMTGSGNYASLIGQRFKLACSKNNMSQDPRRLRTDLFRASKKQLNLF